MHRAPTLSSERITTPSAVGHSRTPFNEKAKNMTTLTGRPDNFVRIRESQYSADIAAAEARGRASAGSSSPISLVTMSEAERLAGIDALGHSAEFPQLIAQMKQDGISVSVAACEIIKALKASPAAGRTPGSEAGNTAQYAANLEDRVAKAKAQGRTISLALAAAELQREESDDATAKYGARIDERIAKAKAQGRRIGPADAAAELRREELGDPTEKLGARIVALIEKEKTHGRKMSFAEAAAEVRREESQGAVNIGAQLDAQIAKAKAEGRTIGPAQAMAELESAGAVS